MTRSGTGAAAERVRPREETRRAKETKMILLLAPRPFVDAVALKEHWFSILRIIARCFQTGTTKTRQTRSPFTAPRRSAEPDALCPQADYLVGPSTACAAFPSFFSNSAFTSRANTRAGWLVGKSRSRKGTPDFCSRLSQPAKPLR